MPYDRVLFGTCFVNPHLQHDMHNSPWLLSAAAPYACQLSAKVDITSHTQSVQYCSALSSAGMLSCCFLLGYSIKRFYNTLKN
jgi:hypothetical protein